MSPIPSACKVTVKVCSACFGTCDGRSSGRCEHPGMCPCRWCLRAANGALVAAVKALCAWGDHPALTGLPDGAPVPADAPSFDETVKLVRHALKLAGVER